MELAGKFQLHYYLANQSHSMDAIVRNKCEAEALAIFQEVAHIMDIRIVVESVPPREGGLVEIWDMMAQNKDQLTIISSIVIPLIAVVLSKPKSDPELDTLTREATKLSIEEKRLRIEKLKLELQTGAAAPDTVESVSSILDCSQKIVFRKSNFYKILKNYRKVTGISVTPLNNNFTPTREQKYVGRREFQKFVILTDKLPVQIIEDAKIEIISPVLKEGDYQWKGIYEGVTIPFSMLDGDFKNSVLMEEVSFQHGSVIDCVLHIHRKFNEIGDIVPTHFSVSTVIQKTDGVETLATAQGKRFLAAKKFREGQMNLCFEKGVEEDADSPTESLIA